jgi:hypothetical protein
MSRWLSLVPLILALSACATNPAVPRAVQLRQEVLTAIDALEVLAKGIEAAVEAKPPLLTNNQANDVWDVEKAAVRILKATNQNAYAVLAQVLVELEKLPFAEKIRPYISVARLSLAALSPPPQRTTVLAPRLRSESDSVHLSCTTPCLIGAF